METIKLENGVTITGTHEQIIDIAEKLGFFVNDKYYNSSTKGYILISEMETNHLRNAIIKMYKKWIDSICVMYPCPDEFAFALAYENPEEPFHTMLNEYAKREKI